MGTLAISYTYDNNGNVLTMTDGTGTTTRTYDALNRTTSKTVPDIGTSFYVYDITAGMDAGCTAETTTDPKGNITLKVYDPLGRLARVTADGMTSAYTYYDNGSLQTVLYGDGSREDYTFTSDNLLQTLINRKADSTIIDSYAYTYDAAHNLLTKTDSRGITSYTYDVLNRLLTVTEPSGKVTSYTYDASGNRATQTVVLGTETTVTAYTYDPLNRLLGTVTQLDGITTETVTYTYDNNGNQLLQTYTAYIDSIPQTPIVKLSNTYDLFNQLISTVTADGVTVISTYNGDGLRVGKSVNGTLTRYLYEYQRVVLEVNVLGDQTGRNVYGINLLTRQVGVDTFLYMYNGHADVTALLNTTGTIVATYYYDAFGNILEQTGVLSNNILYAGYQYDAETGLYYLNARMYDPVTARFMQEDSFTGDRNDPLSLNLYTYCHNEPLMYSDPTGHTEYKDPGGYGTYYSNQAQAQQKQAEDDKNNARVGTVGTYQRPDWAYPTITNVAKVTTNKVIISISAAPTPTPPPTPCPTPTPTPNMEQGTTDPLTGICNYVDRSIDYLTLGKYSSEDPTVLAVVLGLGAGILNVDLPLDARDLVYDFTHWESGFDHSFETFIDGISTIPILGVLKYSDDIAGLFKYSDEVVDVVKDSENTTDLIKVIDNVPQVTINKQIGKEFETYVEGTQLKKFADKGFLETQESFYVANLGQKNVIPDFSLRNAKGDLVAIGDAKAGAIVYDDQAKGFIQVAANETISKAVVYFTPLGNTNIPAGLIKYADEYGVRIIQVGVK